VAQLVGFACLVGGVVLIFQAVDHNSSVGSSYCIIRSGLGATIPAGQAPCPSPTSYIAPALLAGFGYVVFMAGFLARYLLLKRYGRPTWVPRGRRSLAQRQMLMQQPGMPGSQLGEPPGFVGGMPPGTPGSPTGPPL